MIIKFIKTINKLKNINNKIKSAKGIVEYYLRYSNDDLIVIFMLDASGIVFLERLIGRFEECGVKILIILGSNEHKKLNISSPVIYIDIKDIKYIKGKCIVSQNTGIDPKTMKGFKYRIHTFHSPISMMRIYPKDAFNAFNVFVASGKHHIEEISKIRKKNRLGKVKIIKGGYLRIESIHQHSLNYKKKIKGKTLLIAPSWGGENIINTVAKKLIKELLKENFNVILRPHPGNLINDKMFIDEITNDFSSNKRFIFDSWETLDALCESDILIGDWSGISYEFACALNKPVIFINTKPKSFSTAKNKKVFEEEFREEIGEIVEKSQFYKVPQIANKMIEKKVDYEKKIKRNKLDLFYNVSNCSMNIKNEIIDLISVNVR